MLSNTFMFCLSILKKMPSVHAKWVVEIYEYLKEQIESVIKGFEKTGKMEVVKSAQGIYARCENPFDDIRRK